MGLSQIQMAKSQVEIFFAKQNFCLPKFLEYDFHEKQLVEIEIKFFFFGTPSSVPTTPQIKSK